MNTTVRSHGQRGRDVVLMTALDPLAALRGFLYPVFGHATEKLLAIARPRVAPAQVQKAGPAVLRNAIRKFSRFQEGLRLVPPHAIVFVAALSAENEWQ